MKMGPGQKRQVDAYLQAIKDKKITMKQVPEQYKPAVFKKISTDTGEAAN